MTEQLRLELVDDDGRAKVQTTDTVRDELVALADRHAKACVARYGTGSPYAPVHRDCEHG